MSATSPTLQPDQTVKGLGQHLKLLYPVLTLITLVVIFTAANPRFASTANFLNLLRQLSILLIVSTAGTYVIMMGSIDLSVGSTVTLTGIVTAFFVTKLGPGALLVGALLGAVAGLVNGLLVVGLRIPSFLATLGMLSVSNGFANMLSGGKPVLFTSPAFDKLSQGTLIGSVPNLMLWALAILLATTFVFYRTRFGRYLYAIGGGEKVAGLAGIPVTRIKILSFAVAGALCGLAGALLASRIGAGTPRMGEPLMIDSIAAIVMGGTMLSGGIGGPQRTLLGVMVITVLGIGMNVVNIHPFAQEVIKGIVVVVAVALTIDRSKYELAK